jgi:hypothetical protein
MWGQLIVVGGHSRHVGKTALVENILRASRGDRWVAVKISAHRHASGHASPPCFDEDRTPTRWTQTGRYLAAGAARAWLCRCPSARLRDAAAFVDTLRRDGWNVIVESNRLVPHVVPDLVYFVVSDVIDDWKESSAACLRRADAIVLSAGASLLPPRALALSGTRVARLPVFAFDEQWTVTGLTPTASFLPHHRIVRSENRLIPEFTRLDNIRKCSSAL